MWYQLTKKSKSIQELTRKYLYNLLLLLEQRAFQLWSWSIFDWKIIDGPGSWGQIPKQRSTGPWQKCNIFREYKKESNLFEDNLSKKRHLQEKRIENYEMFLFCPLGNDLFYPTDMTESKILVTILIGKYSTSSKSRTQFVCLFVVFSFKKVSWTGQCGGITCLWPFPTTYDIQTRASSS